MACSDVISHAGLGYFSFFTDQPRNPWQMLAEPWGSAEPRLKITGLGNHWKPVQSIHTWWPHTDRLTDGTLWCLCRLRRDHFTQFLSWKHTENV